MDEILQRIVFGLTSGSIYAIAAVGLTLVYGILRLTNFAHGDLMTFGAYMAYTVTVMWNGHFILGLLAATVLTALLGLGTELAIWRPLRLRGSGVLQLMLVSIGLSLVIRYGLQFFYGADLRRLDVDVTSTNVIGGIRISDQQILIFVLAAIVLGLVGLLLAKTLIGASMRALSDNIVLAESTGIDTRRVISQTWLLAGGLAGFGGVLAAIFINVNPEVGWNLLLTVFAAVIVGGIGNPYGALIGGYVIGLAQELSTLVIPAQYKLLVGFVILVLVLLIRPQGIMGRRQAVT